MIEPVRDRRTFSALRAEGTKVRRGPLSVVALVEPDATSTRIAYAIGKRVGNAVARNRLRRRLRGVFIELARSDRGLPTGALLVSAGPDAIRRTPGELSNDVERLLDALHARLSGEAKR